ncbi:MAG: T9SS type A sorting domain-containing protein, partial [Flavobacteriales bacterium]|nr:T9SS type A sorting domain-containing protein [Flavobacteriales bacterium]
LWSYENIGGVIRRGGGRKNRVLGDIEVPGDVSATYTVTVSDDFGCSNTGSVDVISDICLCSPSNDAEAKSLTNAFDLSDVSDKEMAEMDNAIAAEQAFVAGELTVTFAPNPFSGQTDMRVTKNGSIESIGVVIYSADGRLSYLSDSHTTEEVIVLDDEVLPGVSIVKITHSGDPVFVRVVKLE